MKNYLILAAIVGGVLLALYWFTTLIGGSWRTLVGAIFAWVVALGGLSLVLGFGDLKSSGVMFTTWGFFFTLPAVIALVIACRVLGLR
jgi:hypothetical protein